MVNPVMIKEQQKEPRPDIVPIYMVAHGSTVILENHEPGVTDLYYIKGSMRKIEKQSGIHIDPPTASDYCVLMNPKQGSLRFINKLQDVQVVVSNLSYYECQDASEIYQHIKSNYIRNYLLSVNINPERFFRKTT